MTLWILTWSPRHNFDYYLQNIHEYICKIPFQEKSSGHFQRPSLTQHKVLCDQILELSAQDT